MYHKIGIQRLSPTQISKLLNGHRVRVKHGSGHEIHASAEQHKKIMTAHHKGKAHTLQFDPYQMAQHQHMRGHAHHAPVHHRPVHHARHHKMGHGDGVFDSFVGAVKDAGSALGKPFEIGGVNPFDLGYTIGHDYLGPMIAGHGEGEGVRRRGRPRKHHAVKHGHGIPLLTPSRKPLHPYGYGEGEGEGNTMHGYGRAGRRGRRGKGEGEGIKRRGRKSHGEALMPAGYGEGVKRRGRKSRGEGIAGDAIGKIIGSYIPY
jgi:hypothetical protein